MEDEKIVALYWDRNEQALEETAARYGAYCRTVAGRILADRQDVEECINDTWLQAWNSIPPKRPARLATFLGKITRNLAIDRQRMASAQKRGGRQYELALEEIAPYLRSEDGPESQVVPSDLRESLDDFLSGLNVSERRVFIRRYFHLCPVTEIAEQYGYSIAKTKAMLHRTKKKLQKHLSGTGVLK